MESHDRQTKVGHAHTTVPADAREGSSPHLGLLLKDRYLIEKELGRGGIGIVYLAHDQQLLARPVVVKVLAVAHHDEKFAAWFRKKFRQEMEALARINHPGVVGVLDAGETSDGKAFLVMQYVVGQTLRSVMAAHGLTFERTARIAKQMGQALSAAHAKGVCHRDLKPENVMLEDLGGGAEQVKLIDFGVSHLKDSQVVTDADVTFVAGTLPYMAPEQLLGQPTAASDIYGFGALVYEMVTGRPPLRADSMAALYEKQRQGELIPPRELNPVLPEKANAAILRALAFKQEDRFPSAREFAEELARGLTDATTAQLPPGARYDAATAAVASQTTTPDNTRVQAPPDKLRRAPVLVGATLLLIAVLAATWWFLRADRRAAPTPAPTSASGASSERQLVYWTMVQEWRNEKPYGPQRRVAREMIVPSNYRVWLHTSSPQTGFLYLLNEGPTPTGDLPSYVLLFPSPNTNNGQAQLQADQPITFPRHEAGLKLDDEQGTEKIWLVWAARSLPEFEAVKDVVNPQDQGVIKDAARIRALRELIRQQHQPNALTIATDEAAKQTTVKGRGDVLVHLVKLEHH
jgi:eukaryotic-like serine/threonine-protein kinase